VDRLGDLAGWQPEVADLVRAAGDKLTRQAVRRLAFGRDVSPRVVDFLLELVAATPVRELVRYVATVGAHHRYDALHELKRAHVLIIAGGGDAILPFSHSERIAEVLSEAQLVRIEDTGNVPQLEAPEVVNSYLIDLLQRSCGVDGAAGDHESTLSKRLRRWFS
jgi:pimeloyl-ACP methyl ester carboxylesterase